MPASSRIRRGPGTELGGPDPRQRAEGPLGHRDRAQDGQDHERRQQRVRHGEPDHQGHVALEPLEEPLGQRDAGGLGLGADVADGERDDQGREGQSGLQRLPLARQRPVQAAEQDHVGDAVQHRVEEGAPPAGLAAQASHGPVEDVQESRRDQQEPGNEPVAAEQQHPDADVGGQSEDREVPRPEPRPVDPGEDHPVRPRERPPHRGGRQALGLAGGRHVADPRRILVAGCARSAHPARLTPPRFPRPVAQARGSKPTTR